MSANDAIMGMIRAMEACGIRPIDSIADRLGPSLIRFRCEGDGTGKANGWAVLHLDGKPAGAFGNYRMGISEKWRATGSRSLSKTERHALNQVIRREREKREADLSFRQAAAAAACVERWSTSSAVDPAHGYLVRKKLDGEGLRQFGNKLLVPMYDEQGKLWNLQSIDPDGVKRFAKNGRQKGLSALIGVPDGVLCIGEGYATCAAVRRATGHAVALAFSASNMETVAVAMRALFPDIDLILLADDDAHLVDHPHIRKNIGLEAARVAAMAVGGRVALPPRGDMPCA